MKILIFTFVALLNFNTISFHDSVTATFNVIERGEVLMLEIDFDTHDFLKSTNTKEHKITKETFSTYLNKVSSWEINDIKITPDVLSIKSHHHHTKVICFLGKADKKITSIKVKNEFLLDINMHSNIIKLDLNQTFKDFRLHKGRKEIKVDYTK